jgi:CBS domain-containing protein
MARYERDYGREYGRWGSSGSQPIGGMRSDGWGGNSSWRDFPGEEGWFGAGYEGMPESGGYDPGLRGGREEGWGGRGQGGSRGGYGGDYRARGGGPGGRGWEGGYGGGGREWGYGGREGGSAGREGGFGQWQQQQQRGGQRGRSRAADIMTENPQVVTPDAPLSEVAQKMRDLDVGIIPVVESQENRRLKGVITDRDIAIRAIAEGKDGTTTVGDCMTDHVRSVNKNDSVSDVMRVMRQEQVRRVPVTDREGRLVGIIAQADLAVDYASSDRDREAELGETIERISEPARPQRGGEGY